MTCGIFYSSLLIAVKVGSYLCGAPSSKLYLPILGLTECIFQSQALSGYNYFLVLALPIEFIRIKILSRIKHTRLFVCKDENYVTFYNCSLYFKNIMANVSDDCEWSLYNICIIPVALALTSVINYDRKWRAKLWHHPLMTLEASFTIVICL